MTNPPILDDPGALLRALAADAAPAVRARPDLAETVLARARRPRRVRAALVAGGAGLAVVGALAAPSLLGRGDYYTVTQPSANMESTVRVGERVVFHRDLAPARGDVARVRLVHDGVAFETMLRVVGLPGDTVGCPAGPTGRCAAVVVNGAPVREPYVDAETRPFPVGAVPAGRVFLLGDNRAAAVDSRLVGPVPLDDLSGVAVRIRGGSGDTRPVPGAPAHSGPGDRDNVDPAAPVPPAEATSPS
ncbi:signal peptidase I [Actinomycetes bacterium KLBMP 9797]